MTVMEPCSPGARSGHFTTVVSGSSPADPQACLISVYNKTHVSVINLVMKSRY